MRQRGEVVEAGLSPVVARPALHRPLIAEFVLQLGKSANAPGRDLRHIDQAANLVEHQTSTGVIGLGIKDIDRHVGALVIEVRSPDQQGVLLLS
ncbi:hypothetical protein SDC9_178236 [bioreactor metagenome]|uniref:Uncharacterized protein n=1 Tax=bioreactor metagenome TaxID=1076179 RepID=A0A645GVE6_9ZZZZ